MDDPAEQTKKRTTQHQYQSYLLRLWCAGDSRESCWRASLEDPLTGAIIGFGSPEELFAFLLDRIEGQSPNQKGE